MTTDEIITQLKALFGEVSALRSIDDTQTALLAAAQININHAVTALREYEGTR